MIISKPRSNALFAIGLFLLLSYSLGLVNLNILMMGGSHWYNYAIVVLLLPLATAILIKQLVGYKVVMLKNQTFKVKRPFILKSHAFKTKDIQSWRETIIKTKNGNFRELTIATEKWRPLKLTLQENSNYQRIMDYLNKKIPKKRAN